MTEALQQRKLQLPRIVVVIEELADLMMPSRALERSLVKIPQRSRNAIKVHGAYIAQDDIKFCLRHL